MHIRLTRKFADALNGLDLRPYTVGQVIDMNESLALMLLREGWAEPTSVTVDDMAIADDRATGRKRRGPQGV